MIIIMMEKLAHLYGFCPERLGFELLPLIF